MQKTSHPFACAALVVAFVFLLLAAGQAQNFAPANPHPPAPCAADSSQDPPHVYQIRVKDVFQIEQIEYRKRLAHLIDQTVADEEKGIYDLKKYDEIKRLAKKLRGRK